jgi:O-antigen/teichoic acid export membrane protein
MPVSSVLRRNQDLLRNAGSLAATTGITSFLGFAYWIYAARIFSPEAVGYASAAISTMGLVGTIGMFGLDTMLIGELPRGGNQGGLTMASCLAAFVVSFVLGIGFCLVSLTFSTRFVEINGTVSRIIVFSFGVAITGATLVFDAATIGLMRGGLQLSRNAGFSISKMAALPAIAVIFHDRLGVGIVVSWEIGIIISLFPTAIIIKRGGAKILHRPDWSNLWRLRKLALAHNWLNLAINIPASINPVLVALVVSPAANGAYYIAALITSFLYMVPQSLSTVLFAVASAAPEKIAEKLRFVLRMSLAIGIPAGLVLGLGGRFILSAFGSSYAEMAAGPLWLLAAAYVPGLFSQTYIAVARAHGRFNQAAVFLTAFAVLRMAALVLGGKIDGLYGLAFGMLAVQLVQSLITVPSVLHTAFGSVTVRSAADSVTLDEERLRSEGADEMRLRQQAGVAALLELATRMAPSSPRPSAHAVDDDSPVAGTPNPPQKMVNRRERRPHLGGPTIKTNSALAETSWWPDVDEATFRSRQQTGMAALIAIATCTQPDFNQHHFLHSVEMHGASIQTQDEEITVSSETANHHSVTEHCRMTYGDRRKQI